MKSIYNHLLLIFCICAFMSRASKALSQEPSFNSWTTEAGLSQNTVYSICEDKRGYIWMGTRNGLNRFDGREFKIFYPPVKDKSVTGENDVAALLVDQRNILWVGMSDGLMAYDIDKNIFSPITLDNITNKFTTFSVYQDEASRIWLCTNRGLYVLKNSSPFVFEKFGKYGPSAIPNPSVKCMFQDKNGNIWLGSNEGLTRMKRVATGWEYKTFKNDPENPNSLSSHVITAISSDKYGNLWIGTKSKGINLFDYKTENFTRINKSTSGLSLVNDNIRTIKADVTGNIWIGTQEGISRLNWKAQTIGNYQNDPKNEHGLSQNSVHSIFIDRNNYVWIGTFFGGINLVNPFPSAFQVWQNNGTSSGLSNNVVSSVASDNQGNLWIGTEGGGLNYFNHKTKTFSSFTQSPDGLGSNLIKTIFKDADGHIWIGTHAGGLNLYQNGRFEKYFYHPESPAFLNSEISTIAEDDSQNLWIGLQGGIQEVKVYKRNGTTLTDISDEYDRHLLKTRNIKRIFPDSRQNIWIATSDGMFIVRKGKKIVQSFVSTLLNTASKITHITSIQEDSEGNIWFGVENGGLKKYNPSTQKVYSYSFQKGQGAYDVFGILEDANRYIWASTGSGLIKVDPKTGAFLIYTKADGLPSNAFNYNAYFKDNDGRFYFGGYNGLVSFDPASFLANTTSVPIEFTYLKTLNKKEAVNITPAKELELSYHQNVFTIEFALLNYIKPSKNKYAYQLKGFDEQWIETDNPTVTYMNLKPGKYTLAIKGANNDGKWSATKELPIIIHPPFWATWWAYLIYAILFSTVLFFIIRFFYLQELIRQEEVLHQHKLDFFTNITHEIRTHLTLIMSPVDKMIADRANDNYLQQQFQNIKKNADNLLRLSEELMDFRKVETEHLKLKIAEHDIVVFLKEIYEHFRELSLARNMKIAFTHDVSELRLYFDKEQMEKVFFNLISNAFKFTPDGGKIDVHISDHQGYVKVAVSDNGRGIAPEYKDKLFNNFFQVNDSGSQNKGYGIGLALSNKIAMLHGAKIEVDSVLAEDTSKERKTTFAVLLLKGRTHFKQEIAEVKPRVVVIDDKNKNSYEYAEGTFQERNLPDAYLEHKKLSVLVVDDNPDIRNTIHEILSNQYEVVMQEDARQGWQYTTMHLPDLIISDVMMPHEDGLSFCFRLKSDSRSCHIPVILLTAKTTQQDHIEGLDKGADIYLTKPFNRNILKLSVRNLLTTRERIRERVQQQVQDGSFETAVEQNEVTAGNELDNVFLKEVLAIINKYLDDPGFNVTIMSQKVGMSVPVLYKKIKAITNLSVNDFIKSVKLQKAAELLQQKQLAVYEVCYAVGYQDRKHFSAEFKKKFGKTPKQYALSFIS